MNKKHEETAYQILKDLGDVIFDDIKKREKAYADLLYIRGYDIKEGNANVNAVQQELDDYYKSFIVPLYKYKNSITEALTQFEM
jgi:hypothetical protein